MLVVGVVASLVWRLAVAATADGPQPLTYHLWINPIAMWPDWLLGAYLAERHTSNQPVFQRPALWIACKLILTIAQDFAEPFGFVQFSMYSVVSAVVLDVYVHR